MPSVPQIRSLVEVRRHPTVVRLEHLDDAGAAWITDSFFVTPVLAEYLRRLESTLAEPHGCGVFLIGHYGSGKSHFLAYVTRQVRSRALAGGATGMDVAALSLLNFSGRERLEDAVSEAVGIGTASGDRRAAWQAVRDRHPGGLLLVVDELSEFLRSKPDPNAFNEDIRFLQFLGEWAQTGRFWVMAAMQEAIERTGALEQRHYRKIKDRFPLRFLLTPTHVRDLVAGSVLVKAAGYEPAVAELAEHLAAAMPRGLFDRAAFSAVYPLHPQTLELLEEVRDRFSRERGIVEFVTSQLAGDPGRGIPPFLDEPWGSLLTPDRIVAHFRDLLNTQPEYLAIGQQLFPYYEKHLAELFPKEGLREVARRALDLLVLTHLSPNREALTAEEAAAWLLLAASRLDPARNVAAVRRALERMASDGRYVKAEGGSFRLDLQDDPGGRLERLLRREVAELEGLGDGAVLEILAAELDDSTFDPFVLPRDEWQARRYRWRHHDRTYHVYFGNDEPEEQRRPGLCIRLPWGAAASAGPHYLIVPSRIEPGLELCEAAAMVRLRDQGLSPELGQRLAARLPERIERFHSAVKAAYVEAQLLSPGDQPAASLRLDPSAPVERWLDSYGQWMLQRQYPGFESVAPSHGPLPQEAYRALARFLQDNELCATDVDDGAVRLVREAYLCPMGLLSRRGSGYLVPARLDEKNELVRMARTLLAQQPAPQVFYDVLATSIHGLVHDQVHLLLLFLLAQGELDLVKGTKTYRQCFETLPLPIQYDRVEPGRGLSQDQLISLRVLCAGLDLPVEERWTVFAQRRAVQRLVMAAREHLARLSLLRQRLVRVRGGEPIAAEAAKMIAHWEALQEPGGELEVFARFSDELDDARHFAARAVALAAMPEAIDRQLRDLELIRFLTGHEAVRGYAHGDVAARLEALGEPPGLDVPEQMDAWLGRARSAYLAYRTDYMRRHDAFWASRKEPDEGRDGPPAIAWSQHIEHRSLLDEWEAADERARRARCRSLVSLDFQPACVCGFDGGTAPFERLAKEAAELRAKAEGQVRLFFRQPQVRARVRDWADSAGPPGAGAADYLDGRAPWPDVVDVAAFDRHLAGLELRRELDVQEILDILRSRAWERAELVAALDSHLRRYDPSRLTFGPPAEQEPGSEALEAWAAELVLRHGAPLPAGLPSRVRKAIGAALRPEHVGLVALERLADLGLDEPGLRAVLRWVLEGRVRPQEGARVAEPVRAVLDSERAPPIATAEELVAGTERAYRWHEVVAPLCRDRWMAHLDRLARAELLLPPLEEALRDHLDWQWVVVDCLGSVLLPVVCDALGEMLPGWRLRRTSFALVGPDTSTSAGYDRILDAGPQRPILKVDAVDRLVHERQVGFDALARLVRAELVVAFAPLRARLDPARPLLVFADHGFRLAGDGRTWRHGGTSTLERLVPLLELEHPGASLRP